MAVRSTVTITTNTTTEIAQVHKPSNGATNYMATVFISGTFGGGTVTLQASYDGGTTKVSLPDSTGSAPAYAAATAVNISLGNSSTNTNVVLYAVTSGTSGASIKIAVVDNAG